MRADFSDWKGAKLEVNASIEPSAGIRARNVGLALVAFCLILPLVVIAGWIVVRFVFGPDPVFVGPPVVSPSGNFVARITMRPGGATSELTTKVTLMDLSRTQVRPDPSTEVLFGRLHPCEVLLEWQAADHLVVVYPPQFEADVDVDTSVWNGVRVSVVERQITSDDLIAAYQSSDIPTCAKRWSIWT